MNISQIFLSVFLVWSADPKHTVRGGSESSGLAEPPQGTQVLFYIVICLLRIIREIVDTFIFELVG